MKMTKKHKENLSKALTGKKRSKAHNLASGKASGIARKARGSQVGEKNPSWKGEKSKYRAVHNWLYRWRGKPDTCEGCGKSNLKGRSIHWANIDHQYRRTLDDYLRLCSTCHGKYDKEHQLRKRRN